MLVHLAEVVLQDLQLLLSGSHWLLSGHLLVGQGYGARCCREGLASLPELGVRPHLLGLRFAIPIPISSPLPSGLWLWQDATLFPKAHQGAQLGAQAPQQLLPRFPHCDDCTPTEPSWAASPSLAGRKQQPLLCLVFPRWCIYSQPDSCGDNSCLQPYLGLGVTLE